MLKFELINDKKKLMGERQLYSNTNWRENNSGFEPNTPIQVEDIRYRLKTKFLKVTCSEDKYFKIDLIKKQYIQFSGGHDSNDYKDEMSIYRDRPREIYIDLTENLISMTNSESLNKEYLLKVVESNHNKVEYHGFIVSLVYKNKGLINNPDYDIDVQVYSHELKTVNFVGNTINLTFYTFLFAWLVNSFVKGFKFDKLEYAGILIVVVYLTQLILRTYYIKDTYLNFVLRLTSKEGRIINKNIKNSRFTKKNFETRLSEYYNEFNLERKGKKL